MIRFLFKQPQPRRFEFKPRFYDERREFLESRKALVKRELEATQGTVRSGELLRGSLTHAWRSKTHKQARGRSNRQVLLIACALFLIVYLLYRF